MTAIQVCFQKAELGSGWLGWDRFAHQIDVAPQNAGLVPAKPKMAGIDTHASTRIAGRAGGSVGDPLRPTKPGLAERIVEGVALADVQARKRLTLRLARQIGTGCRIGQEKPEVPLQPDREGLRIVQLHRSHLSHSKIKPPRGEKGKHSP